MNKNYSELTTICSQLKIQSADGKYYDTDVFKGGGQIVPPPLDFNLILWAESQKMRKRDAELGNYIGTNCPHVEIENKLNLNWIEALYTSSAKRIIGIGTRISQMTRMRADTNINP